MSFEKPAVVIDNGSYSIKAGFASDNHPVSMFRTVVGRPSYLKGKYGREAYEVFIGDNAMANLEDLELNHPVQNGRIVNWDNIERIWHHVFYKELKVAPEDRAVILTCSVTSPIAEKIKSCEVFFETLNAPALCVQSEAVLSLYGVGQTTGLCVDIGHDTTTVSPVYEGGLVQYARMQTNYAGAQVSNILKEILQDRKYNFDIKCETIIDDIKRMLYVTPDCAMSRWNYQRIYTLPSGENIDVSQETFMCGEMFFQPNLFQVDKTKYLSLQEAIVTSCLKCDAELRSDLYDVIVPCGGLAVVPGLSNRLADELESLVKRPVNVICSSESYVTTWLGGATFAGLSDSKKMWINKQQYDDYGAKIVINKFV
ncbi:uncharacterized protein LOC131849348 [Achroia grisella]|uniref:uncharacterized protein LOC131849348 n=1 Tax=Achroia grisella TaxID=688607 RepID=UPI0027D325E8|nr:uncharacterized protein LOC131849348 [Achroia grisella]